MKTQQEGSIYKPEREASPETSPAGILILDFQPLELRACLLFQPPSPWYFVIQSEQTNTEVVDRAGLCGVSRDKSGSDAGSCVR